MADWLIRLLKLLLPIVSPQIREALEAFARQFREDARKTENQADDVLADILCWLIGIE